MFSSEAISNRYKVGEYLADKIMLTHLKAIAEIANQIPEYLSESPDDVHAPEILIGPIPIIYIDEVTAYIVFEDYGPVVYSATKKEGE